MKPTTTIVFMDSTDYVSDCYMSNVAVKCTIIEIGKLTTRIYSKKAASLSELEKLLSLNCPKSSYIIIPDRGATAEKHASSYANNLQE